MNVKKLRERLAQEDTPSIKCQMACRNWGSYSHKGKLYCYAHFLAMRQVISGSDKKGGNDGGQGNV